MSRISALLLSLLCSFGLPAQRVNVDVNLNVNHVLGEVTALDREKFITLHADITERDWFENDNKLPNLVGDFMNGYDVYGGRNTGGIQWTLNSQVGEDPARPGFANASQMASLGQNRRNSYAAHGEFHAFEDRFQKVLCTQLHPFYPDGRRTNNGWALSTTDTETEPFGTASGQFYANYLRHFFGEGGATGEPLPDYFEVTNEPLWELGDEIDKVFKFHRTVARELKSAHPSIKVAGYCTAFPDLEVNNFQRWEQRWKKFIDESGADMDMWSIHLYDFPSINNGQKRLRRGSNVEATLDMLEHYTLLTHKETKPFLITEYGASSHDYQGAWSPYTDYLHNVSANALVMQFMERSNNIAQALNYTMLKAKWGSPDVNNVWQARLLRMEGEPSAFSGKWIYSDRVHFYQLWANVRGQRADVKAANLDVLSDAYVDGNKAYVVLNNLAWEEKDVKLNLYGLTNVSADELMVKHYHLDDASPVFDNNAGLIDTLFYSGANIPSNFTIGAEATMVLEYTLSEDLVQDITSNETKYYATEYLKPIAANTAIDFQIQDVVTGAANGEAMLRLGLGRNHGRSLRPVVRVNGTRVEVPVDFRGDAQTDRSSFFGVIEIEVPYDVLQANNTIDITFPDGGGFVSSVSLQVFEFSGTVHRADDNTVSIPSATALGLRVYPNPVSDNVVFELGTDQAYDVSFFNVNGQLIGRQNIRGRRVIDVTDWPAGVYHYVISTDNGNQGRGALVVSR